jgi:hypothetical protein
VKLIGGIFQMARKYASTAIRQEQMGTNPINKNERVLLWILDNNTLIGRANILKVLSTSSAYFSFIL